MIDALLIKLWFFHVWLRKNGLTTYEYLQKTRYSNKIEPIEKSKVNLVQSELRVSSRVEQNCYHTPNRKFTTMAQKAKSRESLPSVVKIREVEIEEEQIGLSSQRDSKPKLEDKSKHSKNSKNFFLQKKYEKQKKHSQSYRSKKQWSMNIDLDQVKKDKDSLALSLTPKRLKEKLAGMMTKSKKVMRNSKSDALFSTMSRTKKETRVMRKESSEKYFQGKKVKVKKVSARDCVRKEEKVNGEEEFESRSIEINPDFINFAKKEIDVISNQSGIGDEFIPNDLKE